jgi:hypothetical protein
MFVCCECCVLSGRGLCDELITRPEESYRLWCVVVCDLETSRMRRPWPALGRSAIKKNVYVCMYIEYSRLCRRHAIPYQYPHFKPAGEQSTILPYCRRTTAMQATAAVRTYHALVEPKTYVPRRLFL